MSSSDTTTNSQTPSSNPSVPAKPDSSQATARQAGSAPGTDRIKQRPARSKPAAVFSPLRESSLTSSLPSSSPSIPGSRRKSAHRRSSSQSTSQPSSPETRTRQQQNPLLVIEHATPEDKGRDSADLGKSAEQRKNPEQLSEKDAQVSLSQRPSLLARRHSPISFDHTRLFYSNAFSHDRSSSSVQRPAHYRTHSHGRGNMGNRKIWVKRPNAVATQVTIIEEDLVDDVKDMILKKYANSLGRNFDPPDVTLKVSLAPHSSRHTNERALAPDENISKILDMHYPGGQSIEEALIIEIPQRRTPKQSPRATAPFYPDDLRPGENGTDYFPPMPIPIPQSPHIHSGSISHGSLHRPVPHPPSISVLETGQVPSLPSPVAGRSRHSGRPKYGRQHTSSPTVLNPNAHDGHRPSHPGVPTPPLVADVPVRRTATPPPRVASPRPAHRLKRSKKPTQNGDSLPYQPSGLLDGSVPPINVLIVEDNMINLRLLEAFLKRLKVRWSTAMDGEIAVNKWRDGGYHLVLMDIQLPVMNGLDATKEIRRLERVNNIGVFSNSGFNTPSPNVEKTLDDATVEDVKIDEEQGKKPKEKDVLPNKDLFKSPVIIVALTASSLQSDRHEALAAGCNDFLTKPVNFDWLSRKVMEWGCMQALIDFDGWRNWQAFSAPAPNNKKTGATSQQKSSAAEKQKGLTNGHSGSGVTKTDLKTRNKHLSSLDGGTSSSGEGGEGAGASSEG